MPFTQFPIPTITATKALLGLANVDNTSDASKPISIAVQAALDLKRSLAIAVPLADLAQDGATSGQVIKWDGTKWAPGTDNVGGVGGGGAVSTVFGRTGDVVPQSNDYSFAQIGAKPTTLSGYGITDAAPSSHVGSGGSAHATADGTTAGFLSPTLYTKLVGIASGATVNLPDATLLDRSNHTGSQAQSTITGLTTALALLAPLANPTFTGTVNGITKSMVGLGAVDNTSDAGKPVSTAQAAAIALRHVNIQFQDEGSNLGAAGTADTVNFAGAGVTAARVSNALTVTIPGYTLPDATNLVTGGVRLTGALGGTATAPTALGYADAAALTAAFAAKANIAPASEDIPTGASYTIVSADNGKVKQGVDSSAQTIILPTGLPTPFKVDIVWAAAAGTITIDAATGVNINGLGDGVNVTLSQAGGAVTLVKRGATENYSLVGAIGDLVAADITNLGSGVATLLATFSSANLAAALTDETGSGAAVFATSPTLVTPILGTPTSGNLSNCTADGTNSVGFRGIPINSQSAAYTAVLADAGKCIYHPSADTTARTFTIPANASVAYPVGTVLMFENDISAGALTIAITTDTMVLVGAAGSTGSRTLAAGGRASAVKVTSTRWRISGTAELT